MNPTNANYVTQRGQVFAGPDTIEAHVAAAKEDAEVQDFWPAYNHLLRCEGLATEAGKYGILAAEVHHKAIDKMLLTERSKLAAKIEALDLYRLGKPMAEVTVEEVGKYLNGNSYSELLSCSMQIHDMLHKAARKSYEDAVKQLPCDAEPPAFQYVPQDRDLTMATVLNWLRLDPPHHCAD